MADLISMKFKGGNELNKALLQMTYKMRRNVLTRAMRRTMAIPKMEIQQAIRSDLTTMNAQARAIYARQLYVTYKVEKNDTFAGKLRSRSKIVSTPRGKTNFARMAHLFEGGVKPHKIVQPKMKRTINHPGIKATPIWAMNFDRVAERMTQDFIRTVYGEMEKEWNKYR